LRRIDTSTAVPDLHGPGKPGFRDGNKALAIPPTDLNAAFFNSLQEENANVVEAAGLTLDPDDNTQLLQAMRIILSNADLIARFTTTGNIALNGLGVQAGGDWPANLTANDFILVKDQATPANNGWYRAQAGAWTRVVYLDEDNEVSAGMLTKVSEGATLADSIWMLTTNNPIDVGTTPLNYARKDKFENSALQGASRYKTILTNGKNSQIQVTAAEIIVKDNQGNSKTLKNVAFTINASAAGLNGLDSGALIASTWYSVYVVYNAATDSAGGIISTAANPLLPGGYSYYGWIGDIRTDGSGNKYPLAMTQTGNKAALILDTTGNVPSLPVLAAGIQGSITTPTYVTSGLSNFVSPRAIAVDVTIHAVTTGSGVLVAPNNNYGAYNSTTRPAPLMLSIGNDGVAQNINASKTILLESMNLYVASSDGNGTVCITGWEYA